MRLSSSYPYSSAICYVVKGGFIFWVCDDQVNSKLSPFTEWKPPSSSFLCSAVSDFRVQSSWHFRVCQKIEILSKWSVSIQRFWLISKVLNSLWTSAPSPLPDFFEGRGRMICSQAKFWIFLFFFFADGLGETKLAFCMPWALLSNCDLSQTTSRCPEKIQNYVLTKSKTETIFINYRSCSLNQGSACSCKSFSSRYGQLRVMSAPQQIISQVTTSGSLVGRHKSSQLYINSDLVKKKNQSFLL